MQVFKTALRIFIQHPVYIGIYIVFLGFMGLFISTSNVDAPTDEFTEKRPDIAIIDRDGSTLSAGLADFLAAGATVIDLEDSRQAMQDASAQNLASYIAIIPEGYGDEFAAAAEAGKTPPPIESVVSYTSIAGNMMDGLVDEYLSTVNMLVSSGTAQTMAEAVEMASASMEESANVALVQMSETVPISQQYVLFMKFSGYTSMLGVIVCVAVLMGAFNRTDIRKRNIASPVSSLSTNLQIGLACLVVMFIAWAWVNGLGIAVFWESLATVPPAMIAYVALSSLAFFTVSLAIGFLLGMLTGSEVAMNAAGNIIGLVMAFLGGLWVPLDVLGQEMLTIAHFMPTFYYGNAIDVIAGAPDMSPASLSPAFGDMGIILLFSLAIFAIALAIGRLRMRSSDAGGNAAAQAV